MYKINDLSWVWVVIKNKITLKDVSRFETSPNIWFTTLQTGDIAIK